MSDPRLDDLAAVAIGAAGADEIAEVEREAARDTALREQLGAYRATVELLESSVARERPGYDLFAGIVAQLDVPASAPRPEPRRRGWRRVLPAFALGAATAAALFVAALALDTDGIGTPDAVAAVSGTAAFAGVHGEARIYGNAATGGVLRLDLADVPAPKAGEHYEVWVLRPDAGEAMEAVGVFTPSGTSVELELDLPGPGEYVAVDVSVEPDAGSPEHSGTSLAGGTFRTGTS